MADDWHLDKAESYYMKDVVDLVNRLSDRIAKLEADNVALRTAAGARSWDNIWAFPPGYMNPNTCAPSVGQHLCSICGTHHSSSVKCPALVSYADVFDLTAGTNTTISFTQDAGQSARIKAREWIGPKDQSFGAGCSAPASVGEVRVCGPSATITCADVDNKVFDRQRPLCSGCGTVYEFDSTYYYQHCPKCGLETNA